MADKTQIESAISSKRERRMFGLSLDSWNNLMVGFLLMAAAFGVLAGVSTYCVVRLQRQSAGDQAERIETLHNENLRLQQRLAPRRLSAEAKAELTAKLTDLKGVKFALSAVGPEPIDLAIDTADALTAAGLIWIDWPSPGDVGTNLPGRHRVGNVALNGTVVRTFNPSLAKARDNIAAALTAPEFEGTRVEPVEPVVPGFPAVLIMIGTKR